MRVGRRRLVQAALVGATLPAGRMALTQSAAPGRAVLVGNTAYTPDDERIAPALKCIRDMELQLRRLGYDVVALHNPVIAQVRDELEKLKQAVAGNGRLSGLFYFVGHGFQSNAENLLVPAGGNLQATPAQIAKTCVSLEKDVFSRLQRTPGAAATVILIDACRTPDKPLAPNEGYNQTLPPEGCHVGLATGPGKRAFTPQDPERHTLFTEMLVSELQSTEPGASIYLSLERVRSKVVKRVDSIQAIVRAFGPAAQTPELASNVIGDPPWITATGAPRELPAGASTAATPAEGPDAAAAAKDLEVIRTLDLPEVAAVKLRALLATLPEGELKDLAGLRLKDLDRVLGAAQTARLNLGSPALVAGAPPRVAEDAQRALRGDKYAALRVAETLQRPAPGELIERTDYGRWMIFSAYLGNGIAAYGLSEYFKNVDRRDVEASRYLNLARANQYTPPRQMSQGR